MCPSELGSKPWRGAEAPRSTWNPPFLPRPEGLWLTNREATRNTLHALSLSFHICTGSESSPWSIDAH